MEGGRGIGRQTVTDRETDRERRKYRSKWEQREEDTHKLMHSPTAPKKQRAKSIITCDTISALISLSNLLLLALGPLLFNIALVS